MLRDKVVIITGSAQGIGKGIALQMAEAGATLVLADINAEKLEKTARELEKVCKNILPFQMDIQNDKETRLLVEETLTRYGRIDVLVNNVGITPPQGVFGTSTEEARKIFDINAISPFLLAKNVAKMMIEKKIRGSILFTSSVHGKITRGRPFYSATKAAVDMFVKDFALEVAEFGIRVNAVAPGLTEKEGEDNTGLNQYVPIGRPGTPKDIGDAMVFLVSEKASFITGQVLSVDGGFSLPHTWYWTEKYNFKKKDSSWRNWFL
ncbi:MAG: SDR family NAD(P)-dependent oxidoreductase [Candidatus Pacebacteria bacterium]|nr:SDR family NAD(P)-dependent oxidoreductase [Candidatus Paceibacterota bacterium]MDD5357041.1 SDR family NAD(P)-dependent oxidoreductase [Candidatus Paceibacterota bacterium]